MKKKSIFARVGIVAVALTLATTSMMSGTLARYTTEASAAGKAYVADFGASVKFGGTEFTSATQNIELNLAPTSTDSYNKTKALGETTLSKLAGDSKTYVDTDLSKQYYYIAPGMRGQIPIVIDCSGSKVAVKYKVEVKYKEGIGGLEGIYFPFNMRLYAKKGSETTKTLYGTQLTDLEDVYVSIGEGFILNKGAQEGASTVNTATFNLWWDWPMDVDDHTEIKGVIGDSDTAKKAYNTWDTEYMNSITNGSQVYSTPTALGLTGVSTSSPASTEQEDGALVTIGTGAEKAIILDIRVTAEQATADEIEGTT